MIHFNPKYFILTLLLITILFSAQAQDSNEFWLKSSALEKSSEKKVLRRSIPSEFEVFQLDVNSIKNKLENAPKRVAGKSKASSTIVSFPNEKGILEDYEIFEASIMEESLQQKYPSIRSYAGKSINNPGSTIRFSVTPLGLNAMIFHSTGQAIFIDPYTSNKESYIIYSKKNVPLIDPFECKVEDVKLTAKQTNSVLNSKAENADDGNLRTFRLAVATTGEYSQFHLNREGVSATATDAEKKEVVLAAIANTMTRVNGIFERDVALNMQLVANNAAVIYLDGATDPFTNNDGGTLINESQTVIDANIGTANYDIGHTFSTGGGGLAQLNSPCTTSKARGITGSNNPIGDTYDIDYVAHEMGHQYGANHTFNSDSGGCGGGNRNNATAVEPGSGSTIMAYAGLCAPNNVQSVSDSYFHLVSIQQMWANISAGNSTCAEITTTNNSTPTIEALSNYTIPVSTPFVLNATANDIDGDNLTYTWEQLDTEVTLHPLQSTATGGPAFRSVAPSSSSQRFFPEQSTVIAGSLVTTWEVIPSVARTMQFGVTVRDNNAAAGQTASDETTITVDDTSGPFVVTSQPTAVVWDAGTSQTVTWDVANTNVSPVNCSFVNILLSEDGGLTYPITLASSVSNTGSYEIVVPNNATTKGRIKVESVGNVFYALNEGAITIQTSEFIMDFTSYNEQICSPNDAVYTFTYTTFLDFTEATTFSAADNPEGTIVSFNPSSATANNTLVEMTITGINNTNVGNYNISVTGTAASTSKTTVINLGVYTSTLVAPLLVAPENDATNVLKPYPLSWNSDVNALNYTIEISESSTFSSLTESATIPTNLYEPTLLQLDTQYFWRVKSINDCGESNFSEINNFTTANEVCGSLDSSDTPLNIPDDNSVGVSSTINSVENKSITDINVTTNITHPWIGDLTLTLISPKGTSVILVASRTDDGDNYTSTTFDSDAENQISDGTAPYSGVFLPQGNLAIFNGEESFGDWTLKVVDSGPADVGQIDNWSIEICGVVLPSDNDNDGIDNAIDNCIDTPNADQADSDGDGIGDVCDTTPNGDDDNDGVDNLIDLCPNSAAGSLVDATGCLLLPSDNFNIEIVSETCPDKNNGQISITANESHNYSTTINGVTTSFITNLTVSDLAPGTYNFCISIEGESFEQCFVTEILGGTVLSGKASIESGKANIEILEGTAPFTIYVNGKEKFETNSTEFNIDVKHGDLLEVKTAVDCEGVYSKTIELLSEIVAYPNPTRGVFEIALPLLESDVMIEVYSIHSQLISKKMYSITGGRVQLSLENQPSGLYIVKVYAEDPVILKLIKN
ncbi:MAG: T9SS type A sorting domain-containing protein [Lutibacter sp.]|uniref:reprolysin-like metallopeptidase n=1 Tax=Lutibacter sp. TaxID=1925666 RepID=UPI0017F4FFA8|nr:zinc-dependent metalloprotease family protein [Lutibacter sp.]MBT8318238.1 proprotein convertase P-domain-containing protein [Lutibacter sp.]NNJ59097.1 T9SS type A sorting domain-containing protein [Lutibacter sp.]